MITFRQKGDFSKTFNFLKRAKGSIRYEVLEQYAQEGIAALAAATPKATGLTSKSWSYKIQKTRSSIILTYSNSNIQNGIPIAIILQYGHATNYGHWVEGVDYINPALKPIFDRICNEIWEEVKKA